MHDSRTGLKICRSIYQHFLSRYTAAGFDDTALLLLLHRMACETRCDVCARDRDEVDPRGSNTASMVDLWALERCCTHHSTSMKEHGFKVN